MNVIFTTDLAYGRDGTVELSVWECDKCKVSKEVLSFDGSDGEYGSLSFCRDCLNAFFDSTGNRG